MLLAIDVGNTNIAFAVFNNDGAVKHHWRMETNRASTRDDYRVWLSTLLKEHDITENPSAVAVASVVPEINFPLGKMIEEKFGVLARFIQVDDIDITVALKNPKEAGVDRLINAYAVNQLYKTPAIVLDFGTATTFDVINKQGHYLGGAIAPGPKVSLNAMRLAAPRLPAVPLKAPSRAIGDSTTSAMQSGLYWGYVGMIKELIQQTQQELEGEPVIVATGGLASLYAPELQKSFGELIYDADLTLKGAWEFWQNRKQQNSK